MATVNFAKAPARLVRVLSALVVCAALLASCSPSEAVLTDRFCTELKTFTGLSGTEASIEPGNPHRLGALIEELNALEETAPEAIVAEVATLREFFSQFSKAPREQRRRLLSSEQVDIERASKALDKFALDECGIFLQRAPRTPKSEGDIDSSHVGDD